MIVSSNKSNHQSRKRDRYGHIFMHKDRCPARPKVGVGENRYPARPRVGAGAQSHVRGVGQVLTCKKIVDSLFSKTEFFEFSNSDEGKRSRSYPTSAVSSRGHLKNDVGKSIWAVPIASVNENTCFVSFLGVETPTSSFET